MRQEKYGIKRIRKKEEEKLKEEESTKTGVC